MSFYDEYTLEDYVFTPGFIGIAKSMSKEPVEFYYYMVNLNNIENSPASMILGDVMTWDDQVFTQNHINMARSSGMTAIDLAVHLTKERKAAVLINELDQNIKKLKQVMN